MITLCLVPFFSSVFHETEAEAACVTVLAQDEVLQYKNQQYCDVRLQLTCVEEIKSRSSKLWMSNEFFVTWSVLNSAHLKEQNTHHLLA